MQQTRPGWPETPCNTNRTNPSFWTTETYNPPILEPFTRLKVSSIWSKSRCCIKVDLDPIGGDVMFFHKFMASTRRARHMYQAPCFMPLMSFCRSSLTGGLESSAAGGTKLLLDVVKRTGDSCLTSWREQNHSQNLSARLSSKHLSHSQLLMTFAAADSRLSDRR